MIELKEYGEYYLAFIDILGFKKIVDDRTCQEIYSIFDDIINKRTVKIEFKEKELAPAEDVQMYIMSDSIVLYIDAKIEFGLLALTLVCSSLIGQLVEREIPVIVRGAIEKGALYRENNVVFGPALTKTYLLQEQSAKFPRIIIPEYLYKYMENETLSSKPEYERFFRGTIYKDEDEWRCTEYLYTHTKDRDLKLIEYFQNEIYKATDPSIREKYIYLKKHLTKLAKAFKN